MDLDTALELGLGEAQRYPEGPWPAVLAELARLAERVKELDVAGDPCYGCGHLSMREHGPGGCIECGCSYPFGGLC